MSETALKCENNASFMQKFTLKLFITFKTAYSCCFSLGGNPDFPDFLPKCFITSTTGQVVAGGDLRLRGHDFDSFQDGQFFTLI